MSSFFAQVRSRVNAIDSLLCIGLDPHTTELSEPTAEAAEAFCLHLIKETYEYAAAYKPNSAFFEAFGAKGFQALYNVIQAIPKDIPIILDVKRGDISTTAAAYAIACFDKLQTHCVTLAPYMGEDSINPFLQDHPERGAFVLCKTSNPSANDFQTLVINSTKRYLYEEVAIRCQAWNTNDNIGLVVGATDIDALRRVRKVTPDLWILAPGIGAQGGNLEEAVLTGLSNDGMGLLVPVSRGISRSENPKVAAKELRDAINTVRQQKVKQIQKENAKPSRQNDFISFALSYGVLKFGSFTLKSGRQSPYFFNAGLFRTGKAIAQLGKFYARTIYESGLQFDVLFGPAYKGITLSATVAIAYAEMYDIDLPFAYNRKEKKDHGEGGTLVGADIKGKRILIIDDVITAGTAVSEAMEILTSAEAIVCGVCISLDRQEKAASDDPRSAIQRVEATYQIPVISIAKLDDLVTYLEAEASSTNSQYLPIIKEYRMEYGVSDVIN